MVFDVRPLEQAHRDQMMGWRYAAPYAVYDGPTMAEGAACRGLFDAHGVLCGFFCWGEEARVPAALPLYGAEPGALDFGVGLSPDYAGRGTGLFAVERALDWLRGEKRPEAFRLAVYAWNGRAISVYARAGFLPRGQAGDFLLMARDERPWQEASRPLVSGMRVYPNDPPFDRHLYYTKENCGFDMSILSMTVHAGTHIDAPAHIGLPGGTESVPLDTLSGIVQLIDWETTGPDGVRAPRILLKNCGAGLRESDAEALVAQGVRLIGVDGLSVGSDACELPVHDLLLEKQVVILENAALDLFAPGFYEMRCLPLLMPGSDGAPARLLLREVRIWR